MADLYHLLEEVEAPREEVQQLEEEWDEDREHLDLPDALREAERLKQQRRHEEEEEPSTPEAADERADLEDIQLDLDDLPYKELQTRWTQEVNSPELLPFQEDIIVHKLLQAASEQEEREIITGNVNTDELAASLLRIDAERVKFMVGNLLQQRLRKIEEYPLFMREQVDRMSDEEVSLVSVRQRRRSIDRSFD